MLIGNSQISSILKKKVFRRENRPSKACKHTTKRQAALNKVLNAPPIFFFPNSPPAFADLQVSNLAAPYRIRSCETGIAAPVRRNVSSVDAPSKHSLHAFNAESCTKTSYTSIRSRFPAFLSKRTPYRCHSHAKHRTQTQPEGMISSIY